MKMQSKQLASLLRILWTVVVLCVAAWPLPSLAQAPPTNVMQIDLQNVVFYNYDTYDYTKFATDSGTPTAIPMKTFAMHIAVGDIVATNGETIKGTFLLRSDPMIVLRPSPAPGQAIADITRGMVDDFYLEFVLPDGTSVGSIVGFGTWGGTPPAGAPVTATTCSYAVTGGTGAFLGVRGQASFATSGIPGAPTASIAEDPANRRNRPGGAGRLILQLLPVSTPQIMLANGSPAVFHSADSAPVSSANPAKSAEVLTLFATGLGPTKPGVDPGQPFPASPLQLVASPVAVVVNGAPAEVLYAGGYPGTTDTYQVNFRLPAGAARGMVGLRVSSAWISGPDVKIPVQ